MSRPITQDNLTKKIRNLEKEVYDPSIDFIKIAFPFAAGWGNYGSTFETASYSKIGQLVVIQGLVTKSSGAPGAGNVIGTLPIGFRPAADLLFPRRADTASSAYRIDILPNGEVKWQSGDGTETDYTSFSGICFVV